MEEFPRSLREFEKQFATEQACRDYLFSAALAGGLSLPTLFEQPALVGEVGFAGVWRMWPPNVGDSRDDLAGHTPAAERLVSCHVLGYHPKEWSQRTGSVASDRNRWTLV
jgi:hypothetical protein